MTSWVLPDGVGSIWLFAMMDWAATNGTCRLYACYTLQRYAMSTIYLDLFLFITIRFIGMDSPLITKIL